MRLRIALTMRTAEAPERGDLLGRDWSTWLPQVLPRCVVMALPNGGPPDRARLEAVGADALILTGGDDLGRAPARDAWEHTLLDEALRRRIPVLAVCRGLQLVQSHFGGRVAPVEPALHAGQRHEIVRHGPCLDTLGPRAPLVASYHRWGVVAGGAASGLQAVAQDPRDGSIEALVAPDHLLLAVLWHPERDRGAAQEALVRRALQGEGAAKCAA